MKDWFMELDSRERLLLIGAGSFLALVLAFLLVIEPLYAKVAALEQQVSQKQADLAFVQRGAAEILARGGNLPDAPGSSDGSRPLVVIVDQTVRQAHLETSLSQNQPTADGNSIKVRFDDAAFDDLIVWLGNMASQQNIVVDGANIERQPAPGLVNASLTLRR